MLSPHSHHSCFTHEVQKSLSPLHSAIKRQCRIQTLSYTSHTSLLVLYVHDKGCCWTFTKRSSYISRGSFVKFWLSNQGNVLIGLFYSILDFIFCQYYVIKRLTCNCGFYRIFFVHLFMISVWTSYIKNFVVKPELRHESRSTQITGLLLCNIWWHQCATFGGSRRLAYFVKKLFAEANSQNLPMFAF